MEKLMDSVTPVEREALIANGWWVHDSNCWHPPDDPKGEARLEERVQRLSRLLGRKP